MSAQQLAKCEKCGKHAQVEYKGMLLCEDCAKKELGDNNG